MPNFASMPNYQGFGLLTILLGWFPLCAFIGYMFERRKDKAKAAPIELAEIIVDPVAPAPPHVHILDIDRSKITVTEIGGILATCIIAGCEEAVYISPGLATAYIGEAAELRR